MNKVQISEIEKNKIKINSFVTLNGWIRNRRDSKSGISFLNIYDGSCFSSIQAIASNSLFNYTTEVLKLTIGCSVIINGKLVFSPGKKQIYEIIIHKIDVFGWVNEASSYPMSAKKHTMEYLRINAHLRPRTNVIGAVSRIRNVLFQSLHKFFYENSYFWVPTPIITSLNTEGAGEMFRVSTLNLENIPKNKIGNVNFNKDFFSKESFLTVSGQLTLEAYACALSKVYTFGPTFRAENSNTGRHLAEFWMLEVEEAFADLQNIIDLSEKVIKYVINEILKKCKKDLEFFQLNIEKDILRRLEKIIITDFIKIDHKEAIYILLKSNKVFDNIISEDNDLSLDQEKYLVDEYFKLPIIIKNFPKHLKAFYMRINKDKKTVAAIDLLLPGIGEVIGGSQREDRIHILNQRISESKLKIEDYWWYCDLRRYGTVPHSGFGLGFERLLSYITGLKNIRDVIPFPRTSKHANF